MPTPDDHEPPTRASRRPLGRGPGAPSARPHVAADGAAQASEAADEPPAAARRPAPDPDPEPASAPGALQEATATDAVHVHHEESEPPRDDAVRPATETSDDDGDAGGARAVTSSPPPPAETNAADATEITESSATQTQDADEGERAEAVDDGRFTVRLDNFEGPFDLLLQLISKHKMDVTEVALSRVTDEFMAHIHAMGPDWDLDQTTEFLVVAATLLDLKAARLLPAAEVEDEGDLALLEARDLLFARLLQYRAYKRVADIFADRLAAEARRHPRTVGLEPHHAELLPDVALTIGPEGFARLAVKAMQPKPKPQVYVEHIHAPLVSVREQAEVVVARLRELGEARFRDLVADAPDTLTVVARFLALLELYRERAVALDQPEALGDLTVRWTGGAATGRPLVTDEFDQGPQPQPGTPPGQKPEQEPEPEPEKEPQP
ncbi:segregation/condensation protein A [Streptomyces sp. RKND-216]|uniref:segregation and condensation protein A n=1 Tax=Streptomyces sp. RKND-216 TaxID=2562581 RepID=UPI00109DC64E|nr:segregation/condensation protein A [Streptomyces sp. RKND-216]THA27119.1 segregation/condensation protein A [Streptomyces sp. RKND-216]